MSVYLFIAFIFFQAHTVHRLPPEHQIQRLRQNLNPAPCTTQQQIFNPNSSYYKAAI